MATFEILPSLDENARMGYSPAAKRNVLSEELGTTDVFLASDGGAAITGQVIYVDSGYQIMGM